MQEGMRRLGSLSRGIGAAREGRAPRAPQLERHVVVGGLEVVGRRLAARARGSAATAAVVRAPAAAGTTLTAAAEQHQPGVRPGDAHADALLLVAVLVL